LTSRSNDLGAEKSRLGITPSFSDNRLVTTDADSSICFGQSPAGDSLEISN